MNETADEDLTALLDGQLPAAEREQAFRRLAADPALQTRFDTLARARAPLDAAFATLLAQAPVARLRAALPKPRARAPFAAARWAASLLIAAVIGAALTAALTLKAGDDREDWTAAVVEYMQLYTPQTFADLAPSPAQADALAGKVAAALGVKLKPGDLAAPQLAFKTAFLLTYEGAPLGEYVFADAAGAPYLFCVLAENAEPEALHVEQRQALALASWGRRDKRFLVIGPSAEIVRDWSKTLAGRV